MCHKVTHQTYVGAIIHARKFGKADVRPYHCKICGKFHIGHTRSDHYVQARIDQLLGKKNDSHRRIEEA